MRPTLDFCLYPFAQHREEKTVFRESCSVFINTEQRQLEGQAHPVISLNVQYANVNLV